MKIKILVFSVLIVLLINHSPVNAMELIWGGGLYNSGQTNWQAGNFKTTDDFKIKNGYFHPFVGLAWDRAEIDIEGTVGGFKFRETSGKKMTVFVAGITLSGTYDFFKIDEQNRLYVGMGWGLAYWNKTPDNYLMNRSEWPVITQADLGWKLKFLNYQRVKHIKIGYRFSHISAAGDKNDLGVNTQGMFLSLSF